MEHFPKEKNMSDVAKKVRSCWGLGGGSSDLQTEPSLSLAACNPSHEEKKNSEGRGGVEGKRKGVSPRTWKPFPVCRTRMTNQIKERNEWWRKDVPPG